MGASVLPGSALAGDTDFGPNDHPTVFYISKSDWREFENAPVRIHSLGTFEYVPYGISEQRSIRKTLNGGIHMMKLRQFDKTQIGIVTKKEADGHCSSQARAIINGKESELTYIYVKLGKGGITPSVEYVDVHGKDLDTGAEIQESKKP